MGENHFKYFRLKNFKRFKDLEVKDIGQFNLVLGDNNVGKTSLMEGLALVSDTLEEILLKIKKIVTAKSPNSDYIEYFKYFINDDVYTAEEGLDDISFSIELEDGKNTIIRDDRFHFSPFKKKLSSYDGLFTEKKIGNSLKISEIDEYDLNKISIPLIGLGGVSQAEFVELYENKMMLDIKVKQRLLELAQKVFPQLVDFEGSRKYAVILQFEHEQLKKPIHFLGDGFVKTLGILLSTVLYSGKRLIIDEIDAGIHYSRMKDFWKVVLQASKENDVQLFASTHNRECMEAFEKAIKELGEGYSDNAHTITLKESPKTKEVRAYTNRFAVLENALELGNDLR